MKNVVTALLLALCGPALAQTTPTAEQILDNYVVAIGGKDALAKINDMTVQMSTEMNGNAMMITRRQKLPNKFSMVMNAMGMEVFKQVCDGQKVAMTSMQGGGRTLDGPAAQAMIAMNTLFPELRYADMGVKTTLVGPEKVNSRDTYKLAHTLADGTTTWTDNFDAETGLKVQTVTTGKGPQGEFTQTTTYDNYKEVGGIKYPHTLMQQSPRGPMTLTVDSVKLNRGVKDSEFTISQ